MRSQVALLTGLTLLICGIAEAQSMPEQAKKDLQTLSQALPGGSRGNGGRGPLPGTINRVPQTTGAWWTDTRLVAKLGLSADQKKTIEVIFERYRPNIVSARADL